MILVDGRPDSAIPVQDRGLQYGDGVFETLAIVDGHPLLLEEHLSRLAHGCSALSIPCPALDVLRAECREVSAGHARAVAKIIVTRGSGGRGYQPPAEPHARRIVSLHDWPRYPAGHRSEGIRSGYCHNTRLSGQPRLAGIKHLNRLEQVLARAELGGGERPEAVMLDTGGNVVSGTMSNLFALRARELLTAPLADCGIAGTVRAAILARCSAIGLVARQQTLSPADLSGAEALFFTNSVIGLWPVRQFEDRTLAMHDTVRDIATMLVDSGCIAPP